MAEGFKSEKSNTCRICLSFYTEPRLLNCYHVFCTPCLEKLTADVCCAHCPLCRTEIKLPNEGVCGLKKYPFAVTSSNVVKSDDGDMGDVCQLCSDENMGVVKCLECEIILCAFCRDYHKKIKTSKNHKLNSLNNLKLENLANSEFDAEICPEHKTDLSYFCIPCNEYVCNACGEKSHRRHDLRPVNKMAEEKKNVLLTGTSALKSRICVLEKTTKELKTKQSNYDKHFGVVKNDMMSHAVIIKDMFCTTVDILLQKNLQMTDKVRKRSMKVMELFLDELETEQLSISGLINTTENLMTRYSDKQILNECVKIGKQLDKTLKETETGKTLPPLHKLQYEYGELTENKVVEILGKVTTIAEQESLKASFHSLFVPALVQPHKVDLVSSFNKTGYGEVKGLVSSENDNVWIYTEQSPNLHRVDGTVKSSYVPPKGSQKVLRKSKDEIWFWIGKCAKKGNIKNKDGYKVSFHNGKAGCFIHNGNLIVFNPDDKILYEVNEEGEIVRRLDNQNLQNLLVSFRDIVMVETKNSNLVFSQHRHVIFSDQDGNVLNTYFYKDNPQPYLSIK